MGNEKISIPRHHLRVLGMPTEFTNLMFSKLATELLHSSDKSGWEWKGLGTIAVQKTKTKTNNHNKKTPPHTISRLLWRKLCLILSICAHRMQNNPSLLSVSCVDYKLCLCGASLHSFLYWSLWKQLRACCVWRPSSGYQWFVQTAKLSQMRKGPPQDKELI